MSIAAAVMLLTPALTGALSASGQPVSIDADAPDAGVSPTDGARTETLDARDDNTDARENSSPDAEVTREPPQITRVDVQGAPLPGAEHGRADRIEGDGVARRVGRALLWIPRLPFEVGLYSDELYDPGSWKPNTFAHLPIILADRFDKFWGAKLLLRFTRAQLAAAISAGRYSDLRAAPYLLDTGHDV